MIIKYRNITGVPAFTCEEYVVKEARYCLLIPVINEDERIRAELKRAFETGVCGLCDVILCDGGSTDGSLDKQFLLSVGVNALLVKTGPGKQGAQLRMGIWWALKRGYEGVLTVDGNNKDSVEDVPRFLEKLEQGYDFVQGSRFLRGGKAIRTPLSRYLAVRLVHAPVISLTARKYFTDTTNAFRAYSRDYLMHPSVQPLRDVFQAYELLAYLSVRASQLGLKVCEVPVTRAYPPKGTATPTKIKGIHGNSMLLKVLWCNLIGAYNPISK